MASAEHTQKMIKAYNELYEFANKATDFVQNYVDTENVKFKDNHGLYKKNKDEIKAELDKLVPAESEIRWYFDESYLYSDKISIRAKSLVRIEGFGCEYIEAYIIATKGQEQRAAYEIRQELSVEHIHKKEQAINDLEKKKGEIEKQIRDIERELCR